MEAKLFEVRTNETLPYLIRRPRAVSGRCPAILFLHGAGTRGTDISALENNPFFAPKNWISDADSPFLVFAPLCTKDTWFDVFEQLQAFVRMVAAHPEVDPDRLYLLGNSMGGYGAWQLAMTMPEYFGALVPVCGGGMAWNAGRLANVPVWAFHGEQDDTVPVQESVLMVEALRKAGGEAKLTLLPDCGHNSWDHAYESRELLSWLLARKRSTSSAERNQDYADSKRYG